MNMGRRQQAAADVTPTPKTASAAMIHGLTVGAGIAAIRSQFSGTGPTDSVAAIFRPGVVVTLDDACAELDQRGSELTRDQIRNALHYLVRKERIKAVGRAAWRLQDTESPSPASEEPSALSDLSPDKGGEHSNDETGHESHHHDLAGWNGDYRVGASIVGT